MAQSTPTATLPLDAIIIGAGVGGFTHCIICATTWVLNVRAFDGAGGVGGTWWYNRYPGAACRCAEQSVLCLHIFKRTGGCMGMV